MKDAMTKALFDCQIERRRRQSPPFMRNQLLFLKWVPQKWQRSSTKVENGTDRRPGAQSIHFPLQRGQRHSGPTSGTAPNPTGKTNIIPQSARIWKGQSKLLPNAKNPHST